MSTDYEKNALKLDEYAETLWTILGSENEIITKKYLPHYADLEDHIILTRDIKKAREKVHEILKDLINRVQNQHLLYVADTGGSKTQFVHLIINDIKSKPKFDRIIIIPTFNGYYNIEDLFRQIRLKITEKIFSLDIEEDRTQYQERLDEIHKEFRHKIEIRENINLIRGEIEILKGYLNKNKDETGLKIVDNLTKMISSMPSSPSAALFPLLKLLLNFGKDALKISYFFIIDETDQWFESNDFKEEFIEMDSFFRELFSLGLEIPHSFLFTATNVYLSMIGTTQYSHIASISRLKKIFDNADHVSIVRNYIGEDLDNILRYIHGLYQARHNKRKIDKELLIEIKSLMDDRIEWSKRDINCKVISIMNLYDELLNSIEDGRKWIANERRAIECGENFEEMLIKVFNKYGVGKINKATKNVGDIPYDQPHNLDYQLTIHKTGEKCWGEAKFTTTSNKNKILEKLHQVITGLFAISLNTIERYPIWYFIFNPYITENDLIDLVKGELNKYKEMLSIEDQDNPEKLLNFFKPIIFNNFWGIAPLIGGRVKLSDETDIHNLKKWFDMFSDFSNNIPKEWFGITIDEIKPEEEIIDKEKKDEKIKLTLKEEILIRMLSAYRKKKDKGKWYVPGKRSASFKEYLDENLLDYLEESTAIGKECGVLLQAGGYVRLGSKFENFLIQHSIGQLQLEVRKFLIERKKKPTSKIHQKTIS